MNKRILKQLVPRGLSFTFLLFSLNLEAAQVIKEKLKVKKNPFSLSTSLGLTSNLYEQSSNEQSTSADLSAGLSYKLDKSLKLSTNIKINQETQRQKETTLSNMKVSLSKSTSFKNFTLSQSLIGVLPTNEDDRVDNTFRFRVGYAPSISIPLRFLQKNHSLTLGTSLYVNNHGFTQTKDYGFNTQYLNANSVALSSPLSKKLSLNLSAGYTYALNYAGTQKGYLSSAESISYSFNKKTFFDFGIATQKSAFDYDGSYSNFELFDSRASVVFANLTITN